MIEAGAKVAAEETRNKRVGIIGTVGTVDSGIHASYLRELDPEITVIGKACPLLYRWWKRDGIMILSQKRLQEDI